MRKIADFFYKLFSGRSITENAMGLLAIVELITKKQFERIGAVVALFFLQAIATGKVVIDKVDFEKIRTKFTESLWLVVVQLQYYKTNNQTFDPVAINALKAWSNGLDTPQDYIDKYRNKFAASQEKAFLSVGGDTGDVAEADNNNSTSTTDSADSAK